MTAQHDALQRRECWELLATASVGRLALSVSALPLIVPVQFYPFIDALLAAGQPRPTL
jgi:hypothetical protein